MAAFAEGRRHAQSILTSLTHALNNNAGELIALMTKEQAK